MRRRGRPRHDDILTPREWEVLALLREELTNEQIAARLGITHDTAKFHVSEILSKLGVESRQQAVSWAGKQRAPRATGLSGVLMHRLTSLPAWKFAGGLVIAAAAVGLGALAAGVFLTDSDSTRQEEEAAAATATPAPSRTPESLTGDPVLDELVESLTEDDAAALAARFLDVDARLGFLVGGPIGFNAPESMSNAEWTDRLGTINRELMAVVDPVEPDDPVDSVASPPGSSSTANVTTTSSCWRSRVRRTNTSGASASRTTVSST